MNKSIYGFGDYIFYGHLFETEKKMEKVAINKSIYDLRDYMVLGAGHPRAHKTKSPHNLGGRTKLR